MFEEFFKAYQGKFDKLLISLTGDMEEQFDKLWNSALEELVNKKVEIEEKIKNLQTEMNKLGEDKENIILEISRLNEEKGNINNYLDKIKEQKQQQLRDFSILEEKRKMLEEKESDLAKRETAFALKKKDIDVREVLARERESSLKKVWQEINKKQQNG